MPSASQLGRQQLTTQQIQGYCIGSLPANLVWISVTEYDVQCLDSTDLSTFDKLCAQLLCSVCQTTSGTIAVEVLLYELINDT